MLSPLQVVLEPMVVCGEGGEVFMVPSTGDKESLKRPTHKDPKTKKNKKQKQKQKEGILLMVLNNGVMRGSHGHGR